MTTKILAFTGALGNLVCFSLLPGHRFDTVGVEPLLTGIDFGGLIADKAFDRRHHRRSQRAWHQGRHLAASTQGTPPAARSPSLQMASS